MSEEIASLGRRVAKGAVWMIGMRMTVRCLGIISMLVLARLLAPQDFGLVALATFVIGVVQTLSAFGFEAALIQNQSVTRAHYDSAWTLNVACAAISASLLLALADPAAGFFDEPRLSTILYWLALGSFLSGFSNIGTVDFRRSLWFGQEYKFAIATKLCSFFVTIGTAIVWRDYWALVAGILTFSVAKFTFSYLLHPFRPRFGLSKVRELFTFSKWVLLSEYLTYMSINVDRFLIGKFLNAASLGIFTLAKEISTLLSTEIVGPVTRALYPGYSKISGDSEQLRQMFVSSLGLVFVFVWPMGFGLAAVAEPFTLTVLGTQWGQVAGILPYLTIAAALNISWVNVGALFMAVGRPKINTALMMFSMLARIGFLTAGYFLNGLTGVAQAALVTPVVLFPVVYIFVRRELDLRLSTYFTAVWRSVVASLVMFVTVIGLVGAWPDLPDVIRLIGLVTCGATTYLAVLLLLWRSAGCPAGAESQLLQFLRERQRAYFKAGHVRN